MGTPKSDRCLVRATATRWVADDPQPGIIEVRFFEHDGGLVIIHEKCAVIGFDLGSASSYPVEVHIAAEIIAAITPAWLVRLLHGVEDVSGRTDFTVSPGLIAREPGGSAQQL